ncbi:hypothetical protein FDECE_3099 [Fusarium decemcellulare]|nr:hypothetical protein FDECE_3099 [Fusarium decemcellulare]
MSDTVVDKSGTSDGKTVPSKKRTPILRYDQVYDIQNSHVRLIKSVKQERKKFARRRVVLVVRRLVDGKGFHIGTEVDIESKHVTEAMRDINSDVEDISLSGSPPVVPLEIFFHNRTALQKKLEIAKASEPLDEDQVADLHIAANFADDEYKETRANFEHLIAAGDITWDLLWAIFSPNSLVYRYHFVEQHQILKIRTIKKETRSNKSKYWSLNCHIVADDGVRFGIAYEPFSMEIDEFDGARKITALDIFPLEYHENAAQIRVDLLSRGRRFAALNKPRVMNTSGPAMFETQNYLRETQAYKFSSNGRTIVDPASFRSSNPNIDFAPRVYRALSRDHLTEEELLICTPVALGFCLGNKKWGGFAMSRLLDVNWNDQAFQDLVLEQKTKKLILSMVKQHSSDDDVFDDIVSGKGKGIICLFSGPPGSGKTLTAEAVAEITKRPLYNVSAGDLGVEPESLDENLSEALDLSSRWNAVLLLDEADVFLQQRTAEDVTRNALVSIFLRQLEYYQGILILTTNRIGQCDSAFESRIHIPVHYPDIDESARKAIWSTFVRNMRDGHPNSITVDIGEKSVSQLAKMDINGREIKNIFNSARIVAKENGEVLSMSHIELVLSVTKPGLKVGWQPRSLENGVH